MHVHTPGERDAPVPAPDAGVSFVMPVLNEERYLEASVASVLTQDVDGPSELILALGPSTDGTDALARRLAAGDPRVRLISNPDADIPIGLNRAIAASAYPTIVRVDAHSALEPGYTRRAMVTLARVRAANVGGVMRAEGRTPFQRAVARAYNSPIGLGGGAYHSGGSDGPAESAYLGVMRRAVLDEVGGFDESIRRGEDWELNLRIRRAGYRVWFDPDLAVAYWPRERWSRLVRQFRSTGTWRGELVRRYGRRNSLRFFAPRPRGPAGARARASASGCGRFSSSPRCTSPGARVSSAVPRAARARTSTPRVCGATRRCPERRHRASERCRVPCQRDAAPCRQRVEPSRSTKPWSRMRATTRSAAWPSSRRLNRARQCA